MQKPRTDAGVKVTGANLPFPAVTSDCLRDERGSRDQSMRIVRLRIARVILCRIVRLRIVRT